MPHSITNEQSLLQDYAQQVFERLDVGPVTFDWTGARTLGVLVDADLWPQVAGGIAAVQARGADRGFKVLLRSAPTGR